MCYNRVSEVTSSQAWLAASNLQKVLQSPHVPSSKSGEIQIQVIHKWEGWERSCPSSLHSAPPPTSRNFLCSLNFLTKSGSCLSFMQRHESDARVEIAYRSSKPRTKITCFSVTLCFYNMTDNNKKRGGGSVSVYCCWLGLRITELSYHALRTETGYASAALLKESLKRDH